jgi:pSer/pThr/pTyr-binding forkhead associated (FHA) protein
VIDAALVPPAAAAVAAPPTPPPLRQDTRAASDDATVKTTPPRIFATLTYEDKSGQHTHAITGAQTVIGRGGAGYWVDVRIEGAQDVSREHVRLRRDEATGQFFLKDVSLYGTTLNGQRVTSSIDHASGAKQDINVEVPVPAIARIGLADMVFIDFRLAQP